jgi:hypothetical protein
MGLHGGYKDSTKKDSVVVNGTNRAGYCKSFIEDLRKLVNVNSSIKNKRKHGK